ncbi:MAG: WbqC family protein [Alistipes sp.]|nr:WbqC family protein [Alistipes sp.]
MDILPLHYLGNIQYFSKLCCTACVIDPHETYRKQSYRSRCEIQAANGRMALVVNVVNPGNFTRTAVREVRLDHSKRWRHIHWQSLVSAYKNSPYFDFYAPRIEPFYRREYRFLYDLSAELLETMLEMLGITLRPEFSQRYIEVDGTDPSVRDYRDCISPKPRLALTDPHFRAEPYWQVFSDRFPFEANLSVIDLLFCEGPAAAEVLRRSYVP